VPALPLTAERVAGSAEWRQYLERSQRQRAADQAALSAERLAHGTPGSTLKAAKNSPLSVLLARDAAWFAGALWARYYDIATDRPLFGDRDQSIHDDVNEISRERRDGYAWFNRAPLRALARYRQWALAHPAAVAPGGSATSP